jgi:hypothetical protein
VAIKFLRRQQEGDNFVFGRLLDLKSIIDLSKCKPKYELL